MPFPPSRKKLLFGIALSLCLWLLVECAAFIAFYAMERQTFSWSNIRDAQLARTQEPYPTKLRRLARERGLVEREVIHPYLGYVTNPDAADGVSELGFWGSDDPLQARSQGTVQIGLFGGSLAHLLSAELSHTLTRELGQLPRFRGKEVVLRSFAVGGYKQPQQLMALNYLLSLGAEFDLVINIDGFNEVALHSSENGRHAVFPSYPRAWYLRAADLPDPVVRSLRGQRDYLRGRRRSWATTLAKAPYRYSILAGFVWRWRDNTLTATIEEARQLILDHEPSEVSYLATGPRLALESEHVYEELARVWHRSSLQMSRLCDANGVAYFHFLQPNQYVPNSKKLSSEERESAYSPDHPYRLGVVEGYPILEHEGIALVEAGVHFRDLTQIFSQVEDTLYNDDCCHVNEAGSKLLSEVVAREIRETLGSR